MTESDGETVFDNFGWGLPFKYSSVFRNRAEASELAGFRDKVWDTEARIEIPTTTLENIKLNWTYRTGMLPLR